MKLIDWLSLLSISAWLMVRCFWNVIYQFFFYFFVLFCRLLVGAPTAQTNQPGVARGGAVFRCSTENPDECQLIPFDLTGWNLLRSSSAARDSLFLTNDFFNTGNNNASGQQIDQKSGQWFGATVRSAGPNGAVVVSFCLLFWCVAMFLDWLCCWCFDYAGLRSSLPLVLKQLQSQRASGDLLRGQRLVQRVLGVLPMQD